MLPLNRRDPCFRWIDGADVSLLYRNGSVDSIKKIIANINDAKLDSNTGNYSPFLMLRISQPSLLAPHSEALKLLYNARAYCNLSTRFFDRLLMSVPIK